MSKRRKRNKSKNPKRLKVDTPVTKGDFSTNELVNVAFDPIEGQLSVTTGKASVVINVGENNRGKLNEKTFRDKLWKISGTALTVLSGVAGILGGLQQIGALGFASGSTRFFPDKRMIKEGSDTGAALEVRYLEADAHGNMAITFQDDEKFAVRITSLTDQGLELTIYSPSMPIGDAGILNHLRHSGEHLGVVAKALVACSVDEAMLLISLTVNEKTGVIDREIE